MSTPMLLSIQVGLPAVHTDADTTRRQKSWESGIFKYPVSGRVMLNALNLEGDGQSDLHNHGGAFRAVLAYNAEHYPIWRDDLDRPDFPYGAFGENFTVSDLNENNVYMGDIYAVGDVRLQVTQPREPCWKLARKWGITDLTARVFERGWGGWYHRVLQTGEVEAGQSIMLVERIQDRYTVAITSALMNQKITDAALVIRAAGDLARYEFLSPGWRETFSQWAAETIPDAER